MYHVYNRRSKNVGSEKDGGVGHSEEGRKSFLTETVEGHFHYIIPLFYVNIL
jgi:hypothetical protein